MATVRIVRRERCSYCGGDGYLRWVEYITHDMALDAGEPTMEGQEVQCDQPCPSCNGSGELEADI